MTQVGWLMDQLPYVGGAEFTQAEFRAAAPGNVEIVDCPPGAIVPDLDCYAVHNCVTYTLNDLRAIENRPAIKYHNDVGPWLADDVRGWLNSHTRQVCCSPLQADYMGLAEVELIPPAIDLDWFARAGEQSNGNRTGAVCVGSWRNYGKAPHRVAEWAAGNGGVDFYGDGLFAPPGAQAVPRTEMPTLLARYSTFVYLPAVIEPFGRTVVEAWATGCSLVINGLVGAGWWITENPDGLQTAAESFWRLLLDG